MTYGKMSVHFKKEEEPPDLAPDLYYIYNDQHNLVIEFMQQITVRGTLIQTKF